MQKNDLIYLDYSATTPVDPRVVAKMAPYFDVFYGNPSSVHQFGQQAEAALETAREDVASTLNCQPSEIIFTSCGSESDNLALRGTAFYAKEHRGARHILISPVEHHAVSHTAEQLAGNFGFELEYLPVDRFGLVQPETLKKHLRQDTALVSIIYANNEIGSINPIHELGEICRDARVPLHTDAVQAGAYLNLDVDELNVDLLSLGAHKFYGPKGVGVLFVRTGTSLLPAQTGGGQEFGLRAGTQNVPYIVGMAEALQIAQEERSESASKMNAYRDRIIGRVLEEIPDSDLTGHPVQRLPNHASFVFEGVDGNNLLMMLDLEGFACSSGSACKTGSPSPSEVLLALGIPPQRALGSLRITLGRWTTSEQIENFLNKLPRVVERNRVIQNAG
jgi:cysteine desulfurase